MRFHLLRHPGTGSGDAVDLFDAEVSVMRQLLDRWVSSGATPASPQTAVNDNWERGTIAKLIIEHCAVRLAAEMEAARAASAHGSSALADALHADVVATHRIVDRMTEISRGVEPVSLATSTDFAGEVEALRQRVDGHEAPDPQELRAAVQPFRAEIADENYVRRHAPTHPPGGRHSGPLLRLQSMYDRLRGVPWAQSTTADRTLAAKYDKEVR